MNLLVMLRCAVSEHRAYWDDCEQDFFKSTRWTKFKVCRKEEEIKSVVCAFFTFACLFVIVSNTRFCTENVYVGPWTFISSIAFLWMSLNAAFCLSVTELMLVQGTTWIIVFLEWCCVILSLCAHFKMCEFPFVMVKVTMRNAQRWRWWHFMKMFGCLFFVIHRSNHKRKLQN